MRINMMPLLAFLYLIINGDSRGQRGKGKMNRQKGNIKRSVVLYILNENRKIVRG